MPGGKGYPGTRQHCSIISMYYYYYNINIDTVRLRLLSILSYAYLHYPVTMVLEYSYNPRVPCSNRIQSDSTWQCSGTAELQRHTGSWAPSHQWQWRGALRAA